MRLLLEQPWRTSSCMLRSRASLGWLVSAGHGETEGEAIRKGSHHISVMLHTDLSKDVTLGLHQLVASSSTSMPCVCECEAPLLRVIPSLYHPNMYLNMHELADLGPGRGSWFPSGVSLPCPLMACSISRSFSTIFIICGISRDPACYGPRAPTDLSQAPRLLLNKHTSLWWALCEVSPSPPTGIVRALWVHIKRHRQRQLGWMASRGGVGLMPCRRHMDG